MQRPPVPPLPIVGTVLEAWRRMPQVLGGAWGVILVWAVVSGAAVQAGHGWLHGAAAVWSLFGWGAVLRLGVSPSVAEARTLGLGSFGFQLRRTELRLLGTFLLCLLCWLIVVTVLALVILALFGGAELDVAAIQARDWSSVGPGWRVAVLAVVTVGGLAVALGLAARLVLAGPATVVEDRMVSVLALAVSRGRAVRLTLILTAVAVPGLLLAAGAGLAGAGLSAAVMAGLVAPLIATGAGVSYRRLTTQRRGPA